MDDLIRKQFAITVKEAGENGGRIVISTGSEDRDLDVVRPEGAKIEAYLKNPVTQWAHNYRDPWATIGRTISLTVSPDGLEAEFELRPSANESDPQNVVLLLWRGGWVRTASIGFRPLRWEERPNGGYDYVEWELLEWSLVPVPANAEALRVMSKALGELAVSKYGRVLSAANEGRIERARDLLSEVLEQLAEADDDKQPANVTGKVDKVTSQTISEPDGAGKPEGSGSGGAEAAAATDDGNGITPEQADGLGRALSEFVNQISDRIRGR